MNTAVPSAPTLTELALRASAGDAEALSRLLADALPYIARMSRRMAADEADAEEIAQDTAVVLWTRLDQFEARCSLESWLFAVIRSQASRKYRRIRARPMSSFSNVVEPNDALAFCHAADARPDAEGALGRLSVTDQKILVGRDLAEMSSGEVADALHISVGAVKSRLHRARARARDHFGSEATAGA